MVQPRRESGESGALSLRIMQSDEQMVASCGSLRMQSDTLMNGQLGLHTKIRRPLLDRAAST